jgi:hypothetical protein
MNICGGRPGAEFVAEVSRLLLEIWFERERHCFHLDWIFSRSSSARRSLQRTWRLLRVKDSGIG